MTGHKTEINKSWETQISQGLNYLIVPPLVKACYGRGKKRFEELEYLEYLGNNSPRNSWIKNDCKKDNVQ